MDALDDLPLFSWAEGNTLLTKAGKKLKRWGSVRDACDILACDAKVIHGLVHTGQIPGYKLNPRRPNSHLRVDLWAVWKHKQSQLAEC